MNIFQHYTRIISDSILDCMLYMIPGYHRMGIITRVSSKAGFNTCEGLCNVFAKTIVTVFAQVVCEYCEK